MTDQKSAATPGSNADVSIVGNNKSHAPKDKACPFCQQQFTSSSLGRHLDLYIKEKNPKPADGLHDVEEIRKLRGGITRRQPRNSTSKREHSILSIGTPGTADRRSPKLGSEREKNRSPSIRRYEGFNGQTHMDQHGNNTKFGTVINRGTWESPVLMNNTPAQWGNDTRSWDGDDRESVRRPDARSRSVSRKILAKASFEQKQKMYDAMETAKAAELALYELVGSLRAAKYQVQASCILDYDPLTMDFPALCLYCLPPPPTLHTSTPIPSATSWSLSPPDDSQYQALRNHFTTVFHNYRISLSFSTSESKRETNYPLQSQYPSVIDAQYIAASAGTAGNQLETKINTHLQAVFRAWQALPPGNQAEIWTISLARSIALKNNQIDNLKRENQKAAQDAAHLRQQVDELSRMQYPREFKIVPPRTTHIENKIMIGLGEQMFGMGVDGRAQSKNIDANIHSLNQIVGKDILDESVHLNTAVERAIARWKYIVKDVGAQVGGDNEGINTEKGINAQHNLSRDNMIFGTRERAQGLNINITNEWERVGEAAKNESSVTGLGSDADADADMEEEDTSSFVEIVDTPPVMHTQSSQNQQLQNQNHHQPPPTVRDHGFRSFNGNSSSTCNSAVSNPCANGERFSQSSDGNSNSRNSNTNSNNKVASKINRSVEGIENQVVGGYVRIGA